MTTTYLTTDAREIYDHHVTHHLYGEPSDAYHGPEGHQAVDYEASSFASWYLTEKWVPDLRERFPGSPFTLAVTMDDSDLLERFRVGPTGETTRSREVDGTTILDASEFLEIVRSHPDPSEALAALASAFGHPLPQG